MQSSVFFNNSYAEVVMPSLETPKKEGIDYFLLDKQRDVIVFMA
jgi:hypothetical protein